MNIELIPSVIETNSNDLRFVAPDFLRGIKIINDNQAFIVGQLALNEGISPHKNINGEPYDRDYQLLFQASLLVGVQKLGNPLAITLGFPFSTFQIYKEKAKEIFLKRHVIEFDTAPYSGGGKKTIIGDVEQLSVMPEAVACALALRKHLQVNGNFFVISFGYGTCEAIFSTEGGLVQRSSLSTYGLRYAVKLMEAELMKRYYLDMKNEHFIDAAFRNGFIFLNRKRVDITELRKEVIKQYYQDVVSPGLRRAFDDKDFERSKAMYLVGGGALLSPLIDEINDEFADIVPVEIPEKPGYLAAIGYCYNSLTMTGGDKGRALGIDIGNSSTVICTFDNNAI